MPENNDQNNPSSVAFLFGNRPENSSPERNNRSLTINQLYETLQWFVNQGRGEHQVMFYECEQGTGFKLSYTEYFGPHNLRWENGPPTFSRNQILWLMGYREEKREE